MELEDTISAYDPLANTILVSMLGLLFAAAMNAWMILSVVYRSQLKRSEHSSPPTSLVAGNALLTSCPCSHPALCALFAVAMHVDILFTTLGQEASLYIAHHVPVVFQNGPESDMATGHVCQPL